VAGCRYPGDTHGWRLSDQVGESTENPFEGGANDVPIAQVSRLVEIELRQMLGETELPPLLQPQSQTIL